MAETEKALPSQPPSKSAPQAPAEKVLRIGIVQAGKVVRRRPNLLASVAVFKFERG